MTPVKYERDIHIGKNGLIIHIGKNGLIIPKSWKNIGMEEIGLVTLDLTQRNRKTPWITEAERRIYASVNYAIICSDNGLSPVWRQAIIWTNADMVNGTQRNKIQCFINQNSNIISSRCIWKYRLESRPQMCLQSPFSWKSRSTHPNTPKRWPQIERSTAADSIWIKPGVKEDTYCLTHTFRCLLFDMYSIG